ncbi:MAG: hypothetical protein IPN20_00945 [Haliscomenobacter sp.]|nr:hypothetical protein [Haliscomenobacter sp.]
MTAVLPGPPRRAGNRSAMAKPAGRPVQASYLWMGGANGFYVEMAQAAGLALLPIEAEIPAHFHLRRWRIDRPCAGARGQKEPSGVGRQRHCRQ